MTSKLTYEELEQKNTELAKSEANLKRVEDALRENQRQLSTLLSNLPGIAYRCLNDADWQMTFISDGCHDLTGYPPEDLLGSAKLPYADIIHVDDRQMVWDIIQNAIEKRQKYQLTYRIITALGQQKWVWEQGQAIYDSQNNVSTLEGFITDIAEAKQTEQELAQSRSFLDGVINGIANPLFVKDESHIWIALNDSFCEMLGYTRDEMIGKSDYDLFPKNQADVFWQHDDIVLASNRPDINEEEILVGTQIRTISTAKAPFTNPITGKRNIVGTIQDITEDKLFQRELQKMQKLKSIGTLAGGIAHDFNNILMALFGYISFAMAEIPENHSAHEALKKANQSMDRATKLTRQLLTFAKGGSPVKENVSVGRFIQETVQFDLSGSNIKLDYQQTADLWCTQVDESQMQQVFSNLAINARQAMPDGGHLYISLENIVIDKSDIRNIEPGNYVKISFRDEGVGIAKKYLDRLFDPYFSTKQTGSGLGLATAYSVLQKHDGHIVVDSVLGQGSTFTVYLPVTEKHQITKTKLPSPQPTTQNTAYKILVMDDEPQICDLVARMLGKSGFSLKTVQNGQQAIELYKQSMANNQKFDAVIMDLTIPGGMGGKETIKGILSVDPIARVIVSSGYSEDSVLANYAEFGFKGVVVKPYTKEKLLEVLADVLAV